jgi:hypothetical protein
MNKNRIILSSAAIITAATLGLAIQYGEEWQMRYHLKQGHYAAGALPLWYLPSFSPVSYQDVRSLVDTKNIVGYRGPIGIGKRLMLEHCSRQVPGQSLFMHVWNGKDSLTTSLYQRMTEKIWQLPYFLRQYQPSSEEIVHRVLRSEDPVRLYLHLVDERNINEFVDYADSLCQETKCKVVFAYREKEGKTAVNPDVRRFHSVILGEMSDDQAKLYLRHQYSLELPKINSDSRCFYALDYSARLHGKFRPVNEKEVVQDALHFLQSPDFVKWIVMMVAGN